MPDGTLLHRSIGHYRLVDFVGAGGMGEVYRAVDEGSGRTVAMKVLSPQASGGRGLSRFYNEARLQAALRHPNVAAFYELIEFQQRPCIVMEYVDGDTLADRVRARGRLPVEEAATVLAVVARALAYVHAQGIVHRDIKPTNIRITPSGIVKLLDFGIAKAASLPGLTQTGSVIGTAHYLSPEQLLGDEATPRSDVWALGVVFYELLTGRVPFDGRSITDVWQRVTTGRYERASECWGVGDDAKSLRRADKVIARCLARDPAQRFQAAEELAAAMDALAGRPRALPGPPGDGGGSSGAPSLAAIGDSASRGWRVVLLAAERHWKWAVALAGVAVVVLLILALRPGAQEPGGGRQGGTRHRLTIDVNQGSAEVVVNGQVRGQTPYTYDGRLGEAIDLELRQPGFEPLTRHFELSQQASYTFTMERVQP